MTDMTTDLSAATLRRLIGQFARPPGVSRADEGALIAAGLVKFHEWPSGHYALTDAGREFLAESAA